MTTLDWFFIIGLVLAVLAILFFILFLFLTIGTSSKVKRLSKIRPTTKKKKKKLRIAKKKLIKKKKSQRTAMILSLLLGLFLGAGAFYSSYYQAMHLTVDDSDSITNGYYLLNDFDSELTKASSAAGNQEKAESNLRYLANSIASYGTKKASEVSSQEGQLALNRYYNAMKELGTNVMRNYTQIYKNLDLAKEYQEDVKKVKGYEQKVFKLYNVNEAALDQKK
ncbi:hypothetical protein ACWOC1_10975 [Enterococcus quebecensis]|uniref:Uncharacterized protein n=1 Tax=Enterococcus quebecensis TaxID=903983 RepID=A0A1E5H0K3_9ENTE|nr:hypothetical protein [Enterococcus quebecensis]OEG18342.1 hypothetical protein BCR23_14010 [Enterococcus quebecensis]OJG72500.1 hypothetical protein RV12_GL000914 [Enterococcus quebecensis]